MKKTREGQKNISKLKDGNGQVTTNKRDILKIVEVFYAELYGTTSINIPKVQNQGSDDIPEFSFQFRMN